MNDLIGVHIVKCPANLLNEESGHIFRYFSLLLQEVVKLPRETKLQSKIDVVFICEEGVHLDHVGMVQEALYFDFPHQLHNQLAIHVRLVDLLQRAHETRSPMSE